MNIKRIGIDLAKQVFQLHGVDHQEAPSYANSYAGIKC
jgi:transposase